MFEILMQSPRKSYPDNVKFLGETTVSELISGDQLAAMTGLTAGTVINSNEPWLMWEIDGKKVLYSKRPYRHSISWDQLNTASIVNDTQKIVLRGKEYFIGLPKGLNPDVAVPFTAGADVPSGYGSEWNRLMYVVSKEHTTPLLKKYSQTVANQAEYDQYLDLRLTGGANGSNSWSRETSPVSGANRIQRGSRGVVDLWSVASGDVGNAAAWRPRLQLIGNALPAGVFLGEVPVSELITGDALASAIGLTAGVSQYSNEPWLKFVIDGKTVYYSKKPYRHSVTWDTLNAINVVSGARTVEIQGRTYKVSLPSGANPQYSRNYLISDSDAVCGHNSEWNRLMYPLISDVSAPGKYSQQGPNQASYTSEELVVNYSGGNGSASWCRENFVGVTNGKLCRGFGGVSGIYSNPSNSIEINNGWRPRLELVS